jgi:hypothetical protein
MEGRERDGRRGTKTERKGERGLVGRKKMVGRKRRVIRRISWRQPESETRQYLR